MLCCFLFVSPSVMLLLFHPYWQSPVVFCTWILIRAAWPALYFPELCWSLAFWSVQRPLGQCKLCPRRYNGTKEPFSLQNSKLNTTIHPLNDSDYDLHDYVIFLTGARARYCASKWQTKKKRNFLSSLSIGINIYNLDCLFSVLKR